MRQHPFALTVYKELSAMYLLTRTCHKCGTEKSSDDFFKTSPYKCKICHRIDKKAWVKNNPEKEKKLQQKYYNLSKLRKFGISEEEYKLLKESQNHSCAICNTLEDPNKSLAIDHCHTTGKVRGLLCTACNLAIGGFKDNIDLLKSAIKYLEKN